MVTHEAPNDLETERSVLGFLLMYPHDAHRVADRLTPADFYRPMNGAIFDVLATGVPIPPAELVERTGMDPKEYLTIQQAAPGPSWVGKFVDRLVALSLRREAMRLGRDLSEAAAEDVGLDDALSEIERLSSQGWSGRAGEEPPAYDEWSSGVSSEYDWVVPGLLERGDRLMFVARPGSGKSTMVRQFAVCLASGLDPFRFTTVPHRKVLFVDLENQQRMTKRKVDPITAVAGKRFRPELLRVHIQFGGMNLSERADILRLSGWVAASKPDVVCIGPLYQMFGAAQRGDLGGEDQARQITRTLDRIRQRYGCALVMETHPPKGGGRDMPVFGSGVWTRWPEFVEGIIPSDMNATAPESDWRYDIEPQRGRRDERSFPERLRRGKPGEFPWVADELATDHRLRENF